MPAYTAYLLRCADGSFYAGVCTDPARRLLEHNASPKGARYTRARRPVAFAYQEPCPDRSSAQKREYALRRLSRAEKERLSAQWLQKG